MIDYNGVIVGPGENIKQDIQDIDWEFLEAKRNLTKYLEAIRTLGTVSNRSGCCINMYRHLLFNLFQKEREKINVEYLPNVKERRIYSIMLDSLNFVDHTGGVVREGRFT